MKRIIQITLLVLIALTSIVIYACTIRGVSGNPPLSSFKNNLDQPTKPFELSPERGRYLLTMSLAENGSFALSKPLADAAFPDVGYIDGRFYIYFAPGISVLALPFYQIGKVFHASQVASFASITFFAILNGVLLFYIARKILRLGASYSLFGAFLFAFGTTSWSYAITLYQHHVTLFFLLSGFIAAWKFRMESKLSWAYSAYVWASYGAALFLDYPNAVLLAPVMVYHFLSAWQVKQLTTVTRVQLRLSYIITAVFCIALFALHGYYNTVNFGGPLRLSGGLIGYKTIREQGLQSKQRGAEKIKELQSEKEVKNFFKEELTPKGVSILLASRDRGLLFYSPVLIIGILGLLMSLSVLTAETTLLIGIVAVNLFLYSSWGDPWGGWAYGPRYLIPTMAVLSLFTGTYLSGLRGRLRRIGIKIVTLMLFGYSSAVSLLGALTTNAVPPKIEADYLKMHYNFLHNLIFYSHGQSGSYFYNVVLSKQVSLQQYAFGLWGVIMIIATILLFVSPLFDTQHES